MTDCAYCEGTGHVVLMNSWFVADGTRLERCGICGGNGKSDYRPEDSQIRRQRELRARRAEQTTKPKR